MKLILTLLALLTGFAGGDVARQAPLTPAAMGSAVAVAEAMVEARVAQAAHRPMMQQPDRVAHDCRHAPCVQQIWTASAARPRGVRAHE